jgi:predicted outer membrane lipoprotein
MMIPGFSLRSNPGLGLANAFGVIRDLKLANAFGVIRDLKLANAFCVIALMGHYRRPSS